MEKERVRALAPMKCHNPLFSSKTQESWKRVLQMEEGPSEEGACYSVAGNTVMNLQVLRVANC